MRFSRSTQLARLIHFHRTFIRYALHVRETFVVGLLLIASGGFAISIFEHIPVGDAIYFSFITALTIGYGDIHPVTLGGRVTAVAIGMVGLICGGLVVAVATRALADTVKEIEQSQR